VTGAGARFIDKEIHGLPIVKVNEMKATGIGGIVLSGKRKALVVNMGTGTSLVAVSDNGKVIDHIGGTGVGGGTIEGLGRQMLDKDRFNDLEAMAKEGETNNVDMTVADAVGGPIGMLPEDATASNFRKLNHDSDPNDVSAAIFNMVSQVVGVIAALAARAHHLDEDVVFVGSVAQSHLIVEMLEKVSRIFKIKIVIPESGQYCTAIGAAKSII
jgi:type II pantothenate kinase